MEDQKKPNKRIFRLVAFALVVLAALQISEEYINLHINDTTLVILGFAAIVLLIPELPNLSRFKYKDFELEFKEKAVLKEVNKIQKLVQTEEVSPSEKKKERPKTEKKSKEDESKSQTANKDLQDWLYYIREYGDLIKLNISNLEKVLRAFQLVELMINTAVEDFELVDKNTKIRSPHQAMQILLKEGFVSSQEYEIYQEFQLLRNKVIHGELRDISDSLTARILDLLNRIVRIFA